tara:strand:- start:503 stop:667 length:165 start_codon:yes stop_codon:yes gene_type:complete
MDDTFSGEVNERLKFALEEINLFDPSHPEDNNPLVRDRLVEIECYIFLMAIFQF